MTESTEYEHSFKREKLHRLTHYKTVFSHGHHIFVYKTVNYKSCIYIKGHPLDRATFLPALITTNEVCQSSVRCYIFSDQISLMVINLLVNKFCFSRVSAIREHGVVHGAESCLALSCVHGTTSPAFWSSRVHFWVPESQQPPNCPVDALHSFWYHGR